MTLEVDFSTEENRKPQPDLEDDEDIEIIVLDLLHLNKELRNIKEARGYDIDNRVHQLALGLEIAFKLASLS